MIRNKRYLSGLWLWFGRIIAAMVPLSALVYAMRILPELGFNIYKEQFLAFFLTLCVSLAFIVSHGRASSSNIGNGVDVADKVPWYDALLVIVSIATGSYVFMNYHEIVSQMGVISNDKVWVSAVGLLLLFEATRRLAGWGMVMIGLVALLYAYFGNNLSGIFQTRVISLERLLTYNYLGAGSILGEPLYVAATVITAFVLFGQVLFLIGGGDAISNLAFSLMGKKRGGPAKVAIFSSALFGSLSGSASANVATTGMITIPMMKKVGYSDRQSGAIEAVASTGGLVLPPVMAATGFLMAEFLGVAYATVALAALIPALLYYFCVYLQVDLEAARRGISGWKGNELPAIGDSLRQVVPTSIVFGVLLYILFIMLWSPEASAFIATAAAVAISLFIPSIRKSLKSYLSILAVAGEAIIFIAIMCAIAGLVVGVLGLTGLGSSLSQNLVTLSGGNIWLLLIFAALGCIILGMGVPVTATYIILVILVGPALVQLGINEMAAHMFVFYYGTLSFLTPPVCLAVFVAASIAKSDPMPTAVYALRYAVVAYLVPFAFVFNEAYLFQGDWHDILHAIVAGIAGVLWISIGLVGYFIKRVHWLTRIFGILLGILSFGVASTSLPYLGFVCAALILFSLLQRQRKGKLMHAD